MSAVTNRREGWVPHEAPPDKRGVTSWGEGGWALVSSPWRHPFATGAACSRRPASTHPTGAPHVRTLENRLVRLMNPPEKTLLGKVLSIDNPSESETPSDPAPLVLEELRRFRGTLCGAKTRRATRCQRKALENGRCPNHGGLSTGPKTREGKLRALANLRQFQTKAARSEER